MIFHCKLQYFLFPVTHNVSKCIVGVIYASYISYISFGKV